MTWGGLEAEGHFLTRRDRAVPACIVEHVSIGAVTDDLRIPDIGDIHRGLKPALLHKLQ